MTDQTPAYEHRVMRCKLDRTVTIAGRRYRPGEPIDGEVPPKHAQDFELGVVAQTPPALEPAGQRVRKQPRPLPVIIQRESPPVRASGLDKAKNEKDD